MPRWEKLHYTNFIKELVTYLFLKSFSCLNIYISVIFLRQIDFSLKSKCATVNGRGSSRGIILTQILIWRAEHPWWPSEWQLSIIHSTQKYRLCVLIYCSSTCQNFTRDQFYLQKLGLEMIRMVHVLSVDTLWKYGLY